MAIEEEQLDALMTRLADGDRATLWFGLATLVAGALMLWYGRDAQRAVLPGIAAGMVPMVLAICANHMHTRGPDGCGTLCVQACMLGGAIAGLAVAGVSDLGSVLRPAWCLP